MNKINLIEIIIIIVFVIKQREEQKFIYYCKWEQSLTVIVAMLCFIRKPKF